MVNIDVFSQILSLVDRDISNGLRRTTGNMSQMGISRTPV